MFKSESVTFEYAKACGLLSKSFTGKRAHLLFEQSSLADLWQLLFKTQPPMIPERLLAEQIEKNCLKQFITQFCNFMKTSGCTSEVLTDLLKDFEIENLKEIVAALCAGEKECPELIDLGSLQTLKVENWPDIEKITEGTEYSWVNKLPDIHGQKDIDLKLDLHFIKSYWNAIQKLSGENKEAHLKMFLDEYIIKNIVWALRLSVYYEMDEEQIKENLFYVTDHADKNDPLAGPAISVLSIPKNDYNAWMKWKYSSLVNPVSDGDTWTIDPVWIEQKAMVATQKNYNHVFHQNSMTTAALVAWYKIKFFELSCIRSAVESLRLNIDSTEAMNNLGISIE